LDAFPVFIRYLLRGQPTGESPEIESVQSSPQVLGTRNVLLDAVRFQHLSRNSGSERADSGTGA
jgi:hypothetical protein